MSFKIRLITAPLKRGKSVVPVSVTLRGEDQKRELAFRLLKDGPILEKACLRLSELGPPARHNKRLSNVPEDTESP